jgi:hypothetical protein
VLAVAVQFSIRTKDLCKTDYPFSYLFLPLTLTALYDIQRPKMFEDQGILAPT